ncbi:hypothetical protein [Lentzea sp. NPDC059081]|uniref:hypothetical protein n=1 Tax=Lentzea sp. NPDC059081 TaxID=3346719 RepID=UPI00369BD008
MGETKTRPWWVQTALAGITGAVMVPVGVGSVLVSLFGGLAASVAMAGFLVVLFVALLAFVAQVAPDEFRLGGSGGGRVCWAVLVMVAGTALWLYGWSISDEAGLGLSGSAAVWAPLTAVLFALVAGTSLRRWYLALCSAAVLVFAGLVLLRSLAATLPPEGEDRAAAAPLESLLVAPVPGYGVMSSQRSWLLVPLDVDPTSTPPSPFVELHVLADAPDCELDPYQTRYPAGPPCEVERPGLVFVQGPVSNAYVHRVDGRRLVLAGPKSFDRAALRDALLTARPAEPEGSFTATVRGYTATSAGSALTVFSPDDKALLPGARNIEFATRTSFEGGCTYGALECAVESPSLRYERFEDAHTVVRVVDGKEVTVRGGMAVGRDVLRTAALAARPPTRDEVRAMLPPPRPAGPDRSPMGAARDAARVLFG